jgi:hypothetical protein
MEECNRGSNEARKFKAHAPTLAPTLTPAHAPTGVRAFGGSRTT